MSSDNTEIVYSPKHSVAPDQDIYGNCILISSTKIILRNIIVVLNNSLKTTYFSAEEIAFIKDLNYNKCNEFMNQSINSDFLHLCLDNICDEQFIFDKLKNHDCINIILIFIFFYYFLWDLNKNILNYDKTLKHIVESDLEFKKVMPITSETLNEAFIILFINCESFQETMDKIFTIDSDVSKLFTHNLKLTTLITNLFDILRKTPKYTLYEMYFSSETEEKIFNIHLIVSKTENYYFKISIDNLIKILNLSSKQKFYTSIGTHLECLDELSHLSEQEGEGHALYIQSIEGCNSHIRNSWGADKSSIFQNICKLLSKFLISNKSCTTISFDGMFMSNDESQSIIDNISQNSSIITEETTLHEANMLLMPPHIRKKKSAKSVKLIIETPSIQEIKLPTEKKTKKKRKQTQERKKRIKEIKREKRREKRKSLKKTKKHSDSDSEIDEIIAQGDIIGER
jgi:hypothetical protein